MTRTALKNRKLPNYTKGEELFNMISHIVGGSFGVVALVLCTVFSAIYKDAWSVVGSAIYGASLVMLYTMSSVYHGLKHEVAKKVMQVLDHCTIYFLIAGTYTPIVLSAIRTVSPAWCWILFSLVWGTAAVATVFTAIDLHKFSKLLMICYIAMGWCVVIAAKPTLQAVGIEGAAWLLAGGISYTIGAVLYGLGKKHKYMHAVFHIFVVLGSVLQFICIFFFIILK